MGDTTSNRGNDPAVFKVLYDLATQMTADRTLEEILTLLVERTRELLGADSSYIALRDDKRGDVYMHTLSGIRTDAFRNMRVPYGTGLGGLVAKSRLGYIIEDYFTDPNIPKRVVDDIVRSEGLISGMAAPIQMGNENLGVLYVFNRSGTRYSQSDLDLLFLIANLAAVAISHDKVERELTELKEGLEDMVAERTAELANTNEKLLREIEERKKSEEERRNLEEKLRQGQKMEAIGRLAGGIAHDLNNLLTSIIGYAEIAESKLKPDSSLADTLKHIRLSGEHAAALTNQLLAFSRKQILKPVLADLAATVLKNQGMLQRLLGEDIELAILADEKLKPVVVDPVQIQQVILNLAANARDAMPLGGRVLIELKNVELDSSSGPGMSEGRYVMLTFTDTGQGMDCETKANIFDPFFTTKEQGKGTGLGLATVHGIVGQSGGQIYVYSEPGSGTVFKIYFPAADGEVSERAETAVLTEPQSASTILIAEDDDGVRDLVGEMLRHNGYTTIEVSSGEEALAALQNHSIEIDLLLTDVVMKGINGRVLAEYALKERRGLKVLFMSGYTEDAMVRHGISQESLYFIQKPFVKGALSSTIARILASSDGCKGKG